MSSSQGVSSNSASPAIIDALDLAGAQSGNTGSRSVNKRNNSVCSISTNGSSLVEKHSCINRSISKSNNSFGYTNNANNNPLAGAIKSLLQNRRDMQELQQIDAPFSILHPEAVEKTNNIIITVLKGITDLSVSKIEEAIKNAGAKDYANESDPKTAEAEAHKNGGPVLEKYNKFFHGGTFGEKTDSDSGALRGNAKTNAETNANANKLKDIGLPRSSSNNQKNKWPEKIDSKLKELDNLKQNNSNDENLSQNISTLQKEYLMSNISLDHMVNNAVDDVVNKYSNQLIREYNQFSGSIEIKKLEPGTVLVRDFGQKQSVKSSCWCLASDLNSAVNCDKDLQEKLAVLPSWNGGGNRAVFVVPKEPPEIYAAIGKIAQQENSTDYEEIVYHHGGGTQYNILTPNDCAPNEVKDTSGGFANAGKAFDKCCFVITNNGIITSEDRQFVQTSQHNESTNNESNNIQNKEN